MNSLMFELNTIRFEITFKTYQQLRSILSFCKENSLYKVNIPCKNSLKKEFLLNSIKISREEFPTIDVIPHFSILYEFRRNSLNTKNYFNDFVQVVKDIGCNQVLLVSGSQKRATLDSISTLSFFKDKPLFLNNDFSIGIAFNPYLPCFVFEEEIIRLERKLDSGLVRSIWIQFGTNIALLESRLEILKDIILAKADTNSCISDINLYGSILIPSKQFMARFKYRPWKGVYISSEFLESLDAANKVVVKLFKTYRRNNITPIIETSISNEDQLNQLIILQKISLM